MVILRIVVRLVVNIPVSYTHLDVYKRQGLDGRYNTRYYAPGYNPALSAFYNQREVEVGNYPYNVRWD